MTINSFTTLTFEKIYGDLQDCLDWEEKYFYLIKLAKTIPPVPESRKNKDSFVAGCQSNVWLVSKKIDKYLDLKIDSNSLLVKGLGVLVCAFYSELEIPKISSTEPEFFTELELQEYITVSRVNGVYRIIEKIKELARQN